MMFNKTKFECFSKPSLILILAGLVACGGATDAPVSSAPDGFNCAEADVANGKYLFEHPDGCGSCHSPFENGISLPVTDQWPTLDANDTVWGIDQEAIDANYVLHDYIANIIIGTWASEPLVDCLFSDAEIGKCKPANDTAAYIKSLSDSPWCP